MTIEELRKLGIESSQMFDRLIKWGWIDSAGRSLSWRHWHKFYNRSER